MVTDLIVRLFGLIFLAVGVGVLINHMLFRMDSYPIGQCILRLITLCILLVLFLTTAIIMSPKYASYAISSDLKEQTILQSTQTCQTLDGQQTESE